MKQAISLLPYIPVRSEPSEKSEMVTQVLFGETLNVLQEKDSWAEISLHSDGYCGWCDVKMLSNWTPGTDSKPLNMVTDVWCRISSADGVMTIPAGSYIRFDDDSSPLFSMGDHDFRVEDEGRVGVSVSVERALELVLALKGVPYLWGGRTVWGLDCSGLSQLFGRLMGIDLARDASQQISSGEEVMFIQDARAGDLAFFGNEERITHVGIVFDKNQILHASGHVRVDRLDQQGIYHVEKGKYTHQLRVIKRIV